MSDSSFGDDDDDLLLMQLVEATQKQPQSLPAPNDSNNSEVQSQLFRAQGEISILRAQLEALQNQRSHEIAKLSAEAQTIQSSAREHVALLKQTVDKLEDEKKFLGNEIRSLSSVKRRRVADNMGSPTVKQSEKDASQADIDGGPTLPFDPHKIMSGDTISHTSPPTPSSRIQLQDDWSQLCHYLWSHSINGADRTSMAFLSKICTERALELSGVLAVPANTPISSCIWDALLELRHLRLDVLIETFCESIMSTIEVLLGLHEEKEPGVLVSIPYLISIVHAAMNFKSSAVTESLVTKVMATFCQISKKFVFVLHVHDEEDEKFASHSNVPYQQRLYENFILASAFDVLESAAVISTQFGNQFSRSLWDHAVIDVKLMQRILPENTERFVSSVQINLVSSLVETLSAFVSEDYFCTSDDDLNRLFVKSLLKVFIIDIGIKEDFMFYGLNRILGNNHDFEKVSQAVPLHPEKYFSKSLVSIPYPVKVKSLGTKEKFKLNLQHYCHLLSLRVRIVVLLESIVVSNRMDLVNSKENIKSIVRIIGYEQNHIMHQPRDELIYMRLSIIGAFVRILFYIIEEHKSINTLIYPETLYEVFVVLSRIAFASDSLSFEAHALLSQIRTKGYTDIGVFNKSCEFRSREMAHFESRNLNPQKASELAGIEGDFANGLEFPYESDTVEIAREILSVCVNHDEADNLYYNMNKETQ